MFQLTISKETTSYLWNLVQSFLVNKKQYINEEIVWTYRFYCEISEIRIYPCLVIETRVDFKKDMEEKLNVKVMVATL